MGGGSPLVGHSTRQAEGIARELQALDVEARPFVAMRYWHPFASETAAAIRAVDPAGILVVSLYPQYSPATSGSSINDMRRALEAAGLADRPTIVVDRYPGLPGYIAAMAESVKRALAELGSPAPHVLCSAHGLPRSYIARGDPYRDEIETSYRALCAALDPAVATSLSFQSRVGKGEWLRPYTEDTIADLSARGVRRLLMVPLGFVSDHIETLHEMDEEYGGLARARGMEFRRVPALNDDPMFAKALAGLLRERLNGDVTWRARSGSERA
jgi:ferrochelatase